MPDTTYNTRVSGRRAGKTVSAPAKTRKPEGTAGKDTYVPEWSTERWKHRVEAEACNHLKREVRDVGAMHK